MWTGKGFVPKTLCTFWIGKRDRKNLSHLIFAIRLRRKTAERKEELSVILGKENKRKL